MKTTSDCHSRIFDLSALPPSHFVDSFAFLDPMDLPLGESKPFVQWTPLVYGETSRLVRLQLDDVRMAEAALPPSLFKGQVHLPGLLLGFGMTEEHLSFVNGRRIPPNSLVFGGANSFFLAHWPLEVAPLQSVGAIHLPPSMISPLWPTTSRLFGVLSVVSEEMDRLRMVLREALSMGAFSPHLLESPGVRAGIAARLVEAVSTCFQSGQILADDPRDTLGDYVDIYRCIVKYIDNNYSKSFSMRDIAADLRISERTVHTVMTRLQGMTLKAHLKLLRLREVRRNLLYGDAEFLVKQAAMRHGFMHQGRFAQEYFRHFGESPSSALARRLKI